LEIRPIASLKTVIFHKSFPYQYA
jgi:WD40 repeat protein